MLHYFTNVARMNVERELLITITGSDRGQRLPSRPRLNFIEPTTSTAKSLSSYEEEVSVRRAKIEFC